MNATQDELGKENQLCQIDGKTRQWHRDTNAKHQFNMDSTEIIPAVEEPKPKREIPVSRIAGDPILRMVLIEKGIITVEEMDALETKLKASGVISTPIHTP